MNTDKTGKKTKTKGFARYDLRVANGAEEILGVTSYGSATSGFPLAGCVALVTMFHFFIMQKAV